MRAADAMQLIAPTLDIVTLSYQYSNIPYAVPCMMTTADVMLTFSRRYDERWTHDGIRPQSFVNIGYIFDSSFRVVRDRARACRSKLEEAGAKFIICYFDESVQHDKYGLISDQDHRDEILALAQLVLNDPCVGLVVKTQFMHNSPQRFGELNDALALARGTGRYVELSHGVHRNIIFPSEAALSADITIGHAVGGTAPLEAALAGGRCILLNPYDWVVTDTRHAQADIVYPSMTVALEAIHKYRKGDPDLACLGDWSAIVGQFDPFRDGRAGHRLRKLLEQTVLPGVT